MGLFRRSADKGSELAREALANFADKASSAIMVINREFTINYANASALSLVRSDAAAFRKIIPGFDGEKIIGNRLDIDLLGNGQSRSEWLSDAALLPCENEIIVGDFTLNVLMNAALDRKGNHIGFILEWRDLTNARLNEGIVNALDRAQGIAEYSLDGVLQRANDKFLKIFGYAIGEVKGMRHAMLVEMADRPGSEYVNLWEKLRRGEFDAGGYKRITKSGEEIWIRASYNPVFDSNGKPFKIIEFAIDITENRMATANFQGQIAAISKTQAIVEFTLDGKVITANENFCKTIGYTLPEMLGQHHSLFVDDTERRGQDYRSFWEKLSRGEYNAGRYRRIGNGGREIWLQSSYNTIMDLSGRPFKIVEFATDVTEQVEINRLLRQAAEQVIAAVKEHDLTQRVPLQGITGEVAALCSGINALIDTMTTVISEITVTARDVASASREISTSTSDLSQRTEEQAASLEETSAAMEEISVTVKKNAENAQEAKNFARDTHEAASRGGAVVARAVQAMSRIEESSRKISDIIGVIDEIARQTNLLALNAAVEAARAGDAGRGFAVVASEVRSLAQRSSQAARDIKDLITNSNNQVKDGVDLVNYTGTTLHEIVASIKKVADIVTDIAAASIEQSTGLEQVNDALVQMDEVTQQNSALVEENAATAKTLERQAKSMDGHVTGFRLAHRSTAKDRSDGISIPRAVMPIRQAESVKKSVMPARRVASRGGSQRSLAIEDDPEWKEF